MDKYTKINMKKLDLYYAHFLETNPNRFEKLYKQTDKKQIEKL